MKATALYATLCLVLGSPLAFSKSETQIRCEQCAQRDKKILELENENARLKGSKELTKLPTSSVTADQKSTTSTYTVRAGDTLDRIARRTGSSAIALGKANGLKSTTIIHPGQMLKVPKTGEVVYSSAIKTDTTYTVKDGDTYTSISKTTGVSVSALTAANPKVKATSLRAGLVLQVRKAGAPAPEAVVKSEPASPVRTISNPVAPVRTISNPTPLSAPKPPAVEKADAPKSKTETAPTSSPKPTPAPAAEKTPAPSSPPMGNAKSTVRSIIIQDETTYGEFATSNGTSSAALNELNGLSLRNDTVLAKGSELYIPAQP